MMLWHQNIRFKLNRLEPVFFFYRELSAENTLYLDRDGVLNKVVLRDSEISSPRIEDEIQIAEDVVHLANNRIVSDWNLVVITNQPDVSRKYIDNQFLEGINNLILKYVPVNAVFCCPHLKESMCECRKPKTGIIDRFRQDYPSAVKKECMIGDQQTDFECAQLACISFITREREYNAELVRKSEFNVSSLKQVAAMLELLKETRRT
jgi:D-glycero-D-manno-heptose 1,7-bisphosphate phosphatase